MDEQRKHSVRRTCALYNLYNLSNTAIKRAERKPCVLLDFYGMYIPTDLFSDISLCCYVSKSSKDSSYIQGKNFTK